MSPNYLLFVQTLVNQIYTNIEKILIQNFTVFDEISDTRTPITEALIFKELKGVLTRISNKSSTRKKILKHTDKTEVIELFKTVSIKPHQIIPQSSDNSTINKTIESVPDSKEKLPVSVQPGNRAELPDADKAKLGSSKPNEPSITNKTNQVLKAVTADLRLKKKKPVQHEKKFKKNKSSVPNAIGETSKMVETRPVELLGETVKAPSRKKEKVMITQKNEPAYKAIITFERTETKNEKS